MHKPDDDSEVQQGTGRAFNVRTGYKLDAKIRYKE